MRLRSTAATVLTLIAALAAVPPIQAQGSDSKPTSNTRAQVRMERTEFMRTHRWDNATENWVLKPEFEAPEGHKTRSEVRAERDQFLRNHRWDAASEAWVPLKEKPRELSQLSREQVRRETREFMRTHEWDQQESAWKDRARPLKR